MKFYHTTVLMAITNGDVLGGGEWSTHPLQSEIPSLSPQFNPRINNKIGGREGLGHAFYDSSPYYY